ncbi:zinc finger FYVE domain-containing protein 1-like isoform X2 [Lineus longissimus]|uniref:zinc finger FYVE domain-containing protein 1-like isoform X2 n=1 Tax=Lineus longissimus TaxID=88925 RepID=UPI00315CCCB4
MSAGSRRHQKSRSSKRFCEEKFACDGVRTEATFTCDECGTGQCAACEAKLHDISKFRYHDRKKIEVPPDHLLCQNFSCSERNYADLSCEECKLNFCFFCDSKLHAVGRKKNHKRSPYRPPVPVNNQAKDILLVDVKPVENQIRQRRNNSGRGRGLSSGFSIKPNIIADCASPSSPTSDDDGDFFTLGHVSDDHFSSSPPKHLANFKHLRSLKSNQPVGLNAAVLDLDVPKENTIPGHIGITGNIPHKHPGFAEPVASTATKRCDNKSTKKDIVITEKPDIGLSANIQELGVDTTVLQEDRFDSLFIAKSDEFKSFHNSEEFKGVEPLEDYFASLSKTPEENIPIFNTANHLPVDLIEETESETRTIYPDIEEELGNCTEIEDIKEESIPNKEYHIQKQSGHSSMSSIPDIAQTTLESSLRSLGMSSDDMWKIYEGYKSFPIVNEQEELQVESEKDFFLRLGISNETDVKVVSIFGNTGDGKSYTLNHTFFGGQEVFTTCPSQSSCTIGVWCAYSKENKAIIVDTEGMLGSTSNANQRTRLLLKVLAISDVVIYRTNAERLHADMFKFLGDASNSYLKHFSKELSAAMKRFDLGDGQLSRLGPSVIIFHETKHTDILGAGMHGQEYKNTVHKKLTSHFKTSNCKTDAFCALNYVGTKTEKNTNFNELHREVRQQLENTSVRAPRSVRVIYGALKALNEKFNGDIGMHLPSTFPDEYFTCQAVCLSCGARCTKSMNHAKEDADHDAGPEKNCVFTTKYNNTVFTCKICHMAGKGNKIVIPKTASSSDGAWVGLAKFAWSGYILECPQHGIIYQSRKYWYGNEEPEKEAVRTEIRHVWPGGNTVLQSSHNAGRKLLDGMSYLSDTVSGVSAKPTKMLSAWMADQIAPAYWIPNSEIIKCHACEAEFGHSETKHHCRACGHGFCDACSSQKKPVPERGWGETPVRVCNGCYNGAGNPDGEDPQVTARKVGETIANTVGFVASVIEYPKDFIKDSARPDYWEPDSEITHCNVCNKEFDSKLSKHHCRSCGKGVCRVCSQFRRKVPSRGWDEPVRVCKQCNKKKGDL